MAAKQKIVLHISSNAGDLYLVRRAIKSLHPSMIIRHVENAEKATEYISQANLFGDLPCLLIMDAALMLNGHEAYKEMRSNALSKTIPIVVLLTGEAPVDLTKWTRKKIVFISRPTKYKEFARSISKALSYCT